MKLFYLLSIANVVVLARYGIMHRFKRFHLNQSFPDQNVSKRTKQGQTVSKDPIYARLGPGPMERRSPVPAISPGQWNTGPLFKRRPTFRRVQIDPDLVERIKNIDKKSDFVYRQSLI